MADHQPLTISAINWREAFPFTNLFRAFRVAIHPSKIVLGLVALLLLYVGGRILDGVCPMTDRAVPAEATAFESFQHQGHPGEKFSDYRDQVRKQVESSYAQQLLDYKVVGDQASADKAAHNGDYLGKLKDAILDRRRAHVADADKARTQALTDARKLSADQRTRAEQDVAVSYNRSVLAAYEEASADFQQAKKIKGEGLFVHFFEYEFNQISNVVRGVREWNWFSEEHASSFPTSAIHSDNPLDAGLDHVTFDVGHSGVIQSLFRFFTVGPVWLLTQHPLYFLLFASYFLILWAIFGGAISRIAAVHVARDEKMSIRSALKFSLSKFLSFLFAPIIPLLIVLVVGILVTIGALIGNIPFIGPIIIGALFFVALAAGFVMALVLLGLVGGFNLMYPTIAVEGSDSFDAISRSFSYLYARPWRLAFYTLVAIVYGALTYLFVRLFIYLMLVLTHKFVGFGLFTHAESTAPLWPTMWPSPATAARLSYDIDFLSLGVGQDIGALLVSFWVYLVIAILGAFAISFYFSANTIIYYLMRREVDATEMDDVYLEQIDDEFSDPITSAPVASTLPPTTPADPAATGTNEPPAPPADVPPPT